MWEQNFEQNFGDTPKLRNFGDRPRFSKPRTSGTDHGFQKIQNFDPAEYLKDDGDIAAYLTVILEENDPALLAAALGDIARARGMTEISKASGITREALYKALRPDA